MAKITKGIIGGISGKIGQVVGSNYKGKSIIQSLKKKCSKYPKNQLRQNGLNLIAVTNLIALTKPYILKVLNDFDSSLVYDWNTIVKDVLVNSNIDIESGLRPMSFGVSDKISNLKFVNDNYIGHVFNMISWKGANSWSILTPNTQVLFRAFSSITGYDFWKTTASIGNIGQVFTPDIGIQKGEVQVLLCFFRDASTGETSQICLNANYKF